MSDCVKMLYLVMLINKAKVTEIINGKSAYDIYYEWPEHWYGRWATIKGNISLEK